MINNEDIRWRGSSCLVNFKNLPDDSFQGAIYIENEYHKGMNRYLRRWTWLLNMMIFSKSKFGWTKITYLPSFSKSRKWRKLIHYQYPNLSKKQIRKIPNIKTSDLLDCLEDPDDARFLKPGFIFYKEKSGNGLTVYEYYPLVVLDDPIFSYKKQIGEILKAHTENTDKYWRSEGSCIGHSGVYSTTYNKDEDYADNMFQSLDQHTQTLLSLFKKQVIELQKNGVPMALLENILHQNDILSKLVITKKKEIILPDYNNMVIKMEPLVKAIFLLFLNHPEGIIFKHLPDYREELIEIYKELRPLGLNERSLQSIEDVTNPCLNSINEKCAKIRAAFVNKFDNHLAKNYFITGERGEAKKITLPRDLVVWE